MSNNSENSKRGKRRLETSKLKFIRNIIITLISLAIIVGIFWIAPDYMKDKSAGKINLVINNNNVTERLKKDIIIEKDIIYISKEDISNFFDNYIYYDEKYNQIITTSDTKVANIVVGQKNLTVNGVNKEIDGTVIEKNSTMYIPFSEMQDVYNVELKYIKDTNIILIDSLDREQIKADVAKKTSINQKAKVLSRTVGKLEKGEKIVVISVNEKGWAKVRTETGIIGYIKDSKIANKITVRENLKEENSNKQTISLVWDYYSEYANVPNRENTRINGINVVSPSFFALEKLGKGNIIDKAGTDGEKYINWAKNSGYEVWAMFSNESMIETTSEILNDYKLREKTINNIVSLAIKYKLDGINLDFENMYKEDKNVYTRFVVELYPRLKEYGITLSVDVTAPDGGDTWSLCFDRYAISKNSDYIVFMGYDQNTASSTKAGTVAGYNWVEININKFVKDIDKEKIILGIPFYTRLWKEAPNGELKSSVVNAKDVNSVIPQNADIQWDDELKQNYVEFIDENRNNCKMWIEDEKSIREKLDLANKYELAGVAFWEKDRETDSIWNIIEEMIQTK